jgi:hypothetical protein
MPLKLPVIIYFGISGTAGEWLRCLLPGGGIAIQNSLLYVLIDLKFLHIGSYSVRNVYVIIMAAVAYCRKRL